MRIVGFMFALSCGVFLLNSAMPALAQAQRPASLKGLSDPAGQRLARALGIKPSAANFARVYADAMKAYESRSKNLPRRIRALVTDINHGATPLNLYRLRVALSAIPFNGNCFRSRLWHYGDAAQENHLGNHMLRLAVAMRPSHPHLAASYAKAAIVCLHMSYYDDNDFAVVVAIKNPKIDFPQLADLNAPERKAIHAYVLNPSLGAPSAGRLELKIALEQYRLSTGGKLGADATDSLVKASRRALAMRATNPRYQSGIISLDWQILNIARHRKAAAEKAVLVAFLDGVAKTDRRPWVRRWASEALKDLGPMPTPDLVFAVPGKARAQPPR